MASVLLPPTTGHETAYHTGKQAASAHQPSPAHDVADDVGMAHEDLVAVLLLLGVGPVDVVPEGSLDPGSILVILLGAE